MSDSPPSRLLRRGEPGWPEGFEHLRDPPAAVWVRGWTPLRSPAVAVVGSRRPTLGGMGIARDLAADLSRWGIQVVSGLAVGIDASAHRGALDAGGETVAVLGCGIDVDYPRRHSDLREEVARRGALVSEHDRGAPPERWHFPRRNRLIAALCAAVVVVEAGERSGALSTARWAVDLGREVLAVPGSIRSPQSAGTNRLIRDGARPLLGAADLLEAVPELAPLGGAAAGATGDGPPLPRGGAAVPGGPLETPLREALDLLGSDPADPDELAATLGIGPAELARRLSELELRGLATTEPGGLVVRRSGSAERHS